MARLFHTLLVAGSLVLLAACSTAPNVGPKSGAPATQTVTGRDNVNGQIVGSLTPKSRFAALQIGMTRAEVEQKVGRPTDVAAQSTGTAWVPYYFGNDTWRTESYYKGEGRLVFDANSRLVLIDVTENARK